MRIVMERDGAHPGLEPVEALEGSYRSGDLQATRRSKSSTRMPFGVTGRGVIVRETMGLPDNVKIVIELREDFPSEDWVVEEEQGKGDGKRTYLHNKVRIE